MSGEAGRGSETIMSDFKVIPLKSTGRAQVIHTLRTAKNAEGRNYSYISTGHPDLIDVHVCRLCRRLLAGGFRVCSAPEADARRADRDWGIDLDSRDFD